VLTGTRLASDQRMQSTACICVQNPGLPRDHSSTDVRPARPRTTVEWPSLWLWPLPRFVPHPRGDVGPHSDAIHPSLSPAATSASSQLNPILYDDCAPPVRSWSTWSSVSWYNSRVAVHYVEPIRQSINQSINQLIHQAQWSRWWLWLSLSQFSERKFGLSPTIR